MPLYNYKCSECGNVKEVLQKINDKPLVICEKCDKDTLIKQVTASNFGFKGTGYYCTDFKNK